MIEQYKYSKNKIKPIIPKKNKSFNYKNFFSKIRKSSMHNPDKRNSLGSIPSKFDNYIFNLKNESKNKDIKINNKFKAENTFFIDDIFTKEHLSWGNYGTGNNIKIRGNILKFSVNNDLKDLGKKSEYDKKNIDSFKSFYSYSKNTNKSTNLTNINISKLNINFNNNSQILKKTKSEPKMKFSKEDRYLNIYYKNKILNKYYPGPGDYNPKNNIESKNNFRYHSLFKERTSFPIFDIKAPTADIGPGSYDISRDVNIPGGNFSKLKKYDSFNSPFNISDKEIKACPGSNNLPGSINIKNIFKNNFFFMINSPRKEKLEKKLGIERSENDIEINKSKNENKKENIKENKYWDKGRSISTDWIFSKLEKKIKEKIREGGLLSEKLNEQKNKLEFKINENQYYLKNENENEIEKNKGKVFSFSKIPRFQDTSNKHVPGPSYYDPDKILFAIKQKKYFNAKEDGWI